MPGRVFLLLTLISFSFYSCRSDQGKTIDYVGTFNLSIKDLSKKSSDISALLTFENKFDSKVFKLKDANIDIYINGLDIGTFYTKNPLSLKSKSRLNLPLSFKFDNFKVSDENGQYPESFKIQLKGKVSFVDDERNVTELNINHKEVVYPHLSKQEKKKIKKEGKKDKRQQKRESRKLRRQ